VKRFLHIELGDIGSMRYEPVAKPGLKQHSHETAPTAQYPQNIYSKHLGLRLPAPPNPTPLPTKQFISIRYMVQKYTFVFRQTVMYLTRSTPQQTPQRFSSADPPVPPSWTPLGA